MKLKYICTTLLIGGVAFADDNNTISQYQFNTLISTYEVSQVVADIKNNNVSSIQISYLSSDLLTATRLKTMILQQSPVNVPIKLTSQSSTIPFITNYQLTPLLVNVYGTSGNSSASKNGTEGSFYNYTTKDNGFYDEDNN